MQADSTKCDPEVKISNLPCSILYVDKVVVTLFPQSFQQILRKYLQKCPRYSTFSATKRFLFFFLKTYSFRFPFILLFYFSYLGVETTKRHNSLT